MDNSKNNNVTKTKIVNSYIGGKIRNFFFITLVLHQKKWLHLILFVLTFVSCMISGVAFIGNKDPFDLLNIELGLEYALLLMFFLSAHEFGHYIAAKIHKVDVTLPYYIPFPISPIAPISFGTMGALIRIKGQIPNKKALFDIGVAGPLAGFLVCMFYLVYGVITLPPIEYLYNIHPNYYTTGIDSKGFYFGDNLLFLITKLLVNKDVFFPPMNEIYHYPYLNIAWFGMFVTALNMLPIGQLDGGHITYAMFGDKQHKLGKIFWWFIFLIGLASTIKFLVSMIIQHDEFLLNYINFNFYEYILKIATYINNEFDFLINGWNGWLLWALIGKFLIKIKHPPINDNSEIGTTRMIIGYVSLIIFILCFSYTGLYFFPYQMF